ncbi:hypothetical protein CR513_49277, partial [Mucuna pruriens]
MFVHNSNSNNYNNLGTNRMTQLPVAWTQRKEEKDMKVVVEIIDAHDLMPKESELSHRTSTPLWNHKLLFRFDATKPYHHQTIEVSLYHERRPIPGETSLKGEGEGSLSNFPFREEVGEIGLKNLYCIITVQNQSSFFLSYFRTRKSLISNFTKSTKIQISNTTNLPRCSLPSQPQKI